ncbi:MAG: hypothetical protein ABI625_09930 [bacterium]
MSPSFSAAAAAVYSGLAAFGVEVTEVHVHLTAVDGSTRDTTISFPPGQDTLVIDIPIPAGENNQPFTALLELRNDQHVVLFSGTQTVIARSANLPRFSVPGVVIQYTGPGTKTKTVMVSPPDTTGSATIPLRASAVDSSGGAVADLLVRWTTSDATIATVTPTSTATATVAGLGRRGSATISAITPSGITGSARVTVVPPPARVVVISGAAQTGIAGGLLAQPLVVEVQATDNLPVPGTPVTFRAVTAGGSVTTASAVTDAEGRAKTTLSLGHAGGVYQFEVTSGALTPLSVSASATPAAPAAVSLVSGDQQVDSVGRTLSLPLVVSVVDQFGGPLSGALITWTTVSGTGAPSSASTTSGSDGRASTTYTLGNAIGTETVSAAAAGLSGSAGTVSFTMRAISRGAASVSIIAGGDQVVAPGTTAPTPLVAQVLDAIGNPVANVPASWSAPAGGASFSSAASLTDATGYVATMVTLGSAAGPVIVTARAGAPTASTTFNVVAGPAAIISRVAGDAQTAPAGTSVAVAPSVKVTDVGGNPVQGAPVTFAVSTGGGSAAGATTATNAAGIATVGSWTLGSLVGANALSATSGALNAVFSATGVSGAASRLAFVQAVPGTITVGVPVSAPVQVQLVDAFDNRVAQSGVVITATGNVQPANTSFQLTATSDAAGLATFNLVPYVGPTGALVLTLTAPSVTTLTTSPIAILHGVAATIAKSGGDAQSATAGTSVNVLPSVLVSDAGGNPVAGVPVVFAVTLGGGSVAGANATTNASGVATVGAWALGSAAGPNTLSATAGTLAGSPVTFQATGVAGSASKLTIVTQPAATAAAGVTLTRQPSIALNDASGNPVALAGVQITASIASGSGALTNATATTTAAGVATFSGLAISGVAGPRVLQFAAQGLATVTSAAINVTAGAAAALSIATQPAASAQSGVPLTPQPVIQLRDAAGNSVATSGVVINASVATGGGLLNGASATTDANGQAAFANMTIVGAAGSRSLLFASGALSSVTSGAIGVSSGAPASMQYTAGNLQSAQVGTAVAIAPSVLVKDADGFPVSNAPVVFAVASGGGVATGLNTSTNASGIATVGSWTLGTVAGTNTLTATAGASSITFSATGTSGAAAKFVPITTPPTSIVVGAPIPGPQRLQLTDAADNAVHQSGLAVTLTLVAQPGSVTTSYQAITDAAGVASFAIAPYIGVSGTATLAASAPGIAPLVSPPFAILAGAPTQLVFITQPAATASAGVALLPQPVLQIADAGGNALHVSQGVTAGLASGVGATLGGTTTTQTNALGQTTFSDLAINGATGVRTLVFNVGSVYSAPSNGIVVGPGTITSMSLNGGSEQQAVVGTAVATPPSVKVLDAFNNPVAGIAVTFTVGSSGSLVSNDGPLGTSTSVSTNASGVASLTRWILGNTARGYTVTATANVNAGSPVGFSANAVAGSGTTLALLAVASPTATNGAALVTQPVVQLKDALGNSVATPGVVVTASITSGNGLLTNATATTDAAGTATFSGLTITGVAGSFVLGFSAPSYTAVSLGAVLVSAGAITQLAVTPSPASVVTGATQQFTAVGKDASNNVVAISPQWAVVNNGGTIDGSGLFTAGTAASTYPNTVRAISNSISAFATVTVVAGPPAQLAPETPPSPSATNGVPLATQPAIQLRDIHGNAVAVAGVTITAGITNGTGSLSNSQATTDASGIARFSGLTITGAAGSFVLRFDAPSYLPATSGPIVVGAGVATQLIVISGISSPGQSGVVFGTPTIIQLADAQGNPVAKANVPVTASIASGGGTLGGVLTVNTNATGIAIFGSLSVTGIAGPRTLSFGSLGLVGASYGPVTVVAR